MKKTISFILIISIAILLVFSLCACGGEDKIVGSWKCDEPRTSGVESVMTASTIQFNQNGTISYISAIDNRTYSNWEWAYNKSEKAYQFTSFGGSIVFGIIENNKLSIYRRQKNDSGIKIDESLFFTKQ